MSPKISVLLSVHEDDPFLDGALDGIAAQTERDWELLVVADGAPAPVVAKVEARAAVEPRLRVLVQERAGLTAALNRALREARGELIARQDCDDLSAPGRLEAQRRFLESKRADLVSCWTDVIDEKGRPIGVRRPPTDADELRRVLETRNCLQHSALFARRDSLLALGGYRPEFRYSQDYDLYLRALVGGRRLEVLPEALLSIRMTPWNITTVRRAEQLRCALAAQADYFAARGVSRPAAWLAMRHHWLRLMLPDPLRRAKRRLMEAFR